MRNGVGEIRQPLLAASVDDDRASEVQLTGVTERGVLITWRRWEGLTHARVDDLGARANGPIAWRHVDANRPVELVVPLGNGATMVRPLAQLLARPLEHGAAFTSIYARPLAWTPAPVASPIPTHRAEPFEEPDAAAQGCAAASQRAPSPASGFVAWVIGLVAALTWRTRRRGRAA